ncbi:MAG: protein kinase, partial [Pirellulaceae bacterium]
MDSVGDVMEIDITRSLEWNPAQAVATSGEWELGSSSSHLMGYHDEGGQPLRPCQPDEAPGELCWQARYVILRQIGQGAQGVVYLGRRDGADGFHVNVALKVFSRHPQWTDEEYGEEMRRVAEQALRISHIQHDNLLMIQNFVAERGGRVMVMEWIDGLDLSRLLCRTNWIQLRQRLTPQEWERLNDVVATEGEDHCRLKPGIAVDV